MYELNKTKYLLQPELASLTALLARHDTRDSLLLQVLIKTGARATEALMLRTEDLNAFDKSVLIRGIKGSNDREIPLPPRLFKALQKIAPPSGLIFDISYQRLHQIWQEWRPVNKKLHALRHTFAIEVYRKTKDLRLLQKALGHKSIVNTMIYSDYHYTTQEMRKLL